MSQPRFTVRFAFCLLAFSSLLPEETLRAQRCPPVGIFYVVHDTDGATLDLAELSTVFEQSPPPGGDGSARLVSLRLAADGSYLPPGASGGPIPALLIMGKDECQLRLTEMTLVHRQRRMRLIFNVAQRWVTGAEATVRPLKAPYFMIVDSIPFREGTFELDLAGWLAPFEKWGDWKSEYPTIPSRFWVKR